MSKLSLVCLIIAVCAIRSSLSSPLMNRIEADGAEKCKGLCKLCDCVGFYCGEECICECNNVKVDRNLNCVEKMQVSSQNMKAPFEILIQGPSSDRFVRSLMAVDELSASQKAGSTDSRFTFSVHQPETEQSTAEESMNAATKDADKEKEIPPSCRAEDSTSETVNTNEDKDASPSALQSTLRSKRQSNDALPSDGPIGEGISPIENPQAQTNEPKVGGPLGLLGPIIGAHVGLGHLGLLHKGLRIHNAVGLHHGLLPLRHALHHIPLIPLLGAANPNADGEPVGQGNQNAQEMPPSDSAPPQDVRPMALADRLNLRRQNMQNIFFRQPMIQGNQGPTPAPPMPEQSSF